MKRGRPPKPEAEKAQRQGVRFEADLWAELIAIAPKGERSAIINEALRRELARRRKANDGQT